MTILLLAWFYYFHFFQSWILERLSIGRYAHYSVVPVQLFSRIIRTCTLQSCRRHIPKWRNQCRTCLSNIVGTHKLLSDLYFLTRMSSTSESLPWASRFLLRFTSGGVSRFHLWWPLLPRFTSGGVSRFHLWWPPLPILFLDLIFMQEPRLGSVWVVFGEDLYFFIIFPFYPPYYTGSLRFVRELSFDTLYF